MAADGRIDAATARPPESVRRRMDTPVATRWCVLGWIVASALFVASVGAWYDGQIRDQWETAVPALAVAQGVSGCAYPASNSSSVPPLIPLVDAGLLSVTGVAAHQAVPYVVVGHRCATVSPEASVWRRGAKPFVVLALLEWLVLLGGFVMFLRASGRGRSRWETAGCCLIAVAPMSAATVVDYLHPEDLIALGLVLAALAMAIRRRWLWCGLLIGLACCAKQYAVLAAVPLVVIVPRGHRLRFASAAIAVPVGVLTPLACTMGRGMLRAAFGSAATPGDTATLVGRLALSGLPLTAMARVSPLVVAGAIALVARRRLGPRILEPVPMLALVGIAFGLRLLFEVNLYSYYFMALGVVLLTLDVLAGRLRIETVGWVVVATGFFPPRFEQLELVTDRHTALIQALVIAWGLALAIAPIVRYRRDSVGSPTTVRPVVEAVGRISG